MKELRFNISADLGPLKDWIEEHLRKRLNDTIEDGFDVDGFWVGKECALKSRLNLALELEDYIGAEIIRKQIETL